MRIVICNANSLHHKNHKGLKQILEYLGYDYLFTNNQNMDLSAYDVVYSPSKPISKTSPRTKFIYGPHFSVFPQRDQLKQIPIGQKAIYIQPSEWAKRAWGTINIPLHTFSFPVDTQRFSPVINVQQRTKVFVYTKRRDPRHVEYVCNFLKQNGIEYEFFDYVKKYREENYLKTLQQAKYGIIVDAHESQGFAIEEALSSGVPLLVWNVKTMNQEWRSRYPPVPCTTIPYWDERCGEFFYNAEEFLLTFQKFTQNLLNYKPREYILENLNVEACASRFKELIEF
jgi:hypothetical protein